MKKKFFFVSRLTLQKLVYFKKNRVFLDVQKLRYEMKIIAKMV